jgi:catechol 2,3-dioxygenase-like lactoylglutathione lyase family enzyme
MAYHHLAMAAADMTAIHHFYETLLEFELVKVEVGPVPDGGWAKHFFYRMGGDDSAFIAFWELHEVPGCDKVETSLSKAAGVPDQINHLAFNAPDLESLRHRRDVWQKAGLSVLEVDHNWCHSIYTKDPNGNMVEVCTTTGQFSEKDRQLALKALNSDEISYSKPPGGIEIHRPKTD